MFGSLGLLEIVLILVVVVLVFGANKLPQLGEGLGKAIKNFRKASSEPEEIDLTKVKETDQKTDLNKDKTRDPE